MRNLSLFMQWLFYWPQPKKEVKPPVLCTVSFIYNAKGVIGSAKKNLVETIFCYIEDGATNKDCVPLFNPPGIGKAQCVISDILIMPIKIVRKK